MVVNSKIKHDIYQHKYPYRRLKRGGRNRMTIKKKEIIKALEDTINRLEETLTSATFMSESDEIEFKGDNFNSFVDVTEDIEGAEAALMIAESRIGEMAQILSEEIENLRTLIEKIEKDMG
jgi:hypothetical protein